MHTSDRGGRDWDGRDTNSLAADAASSTTERVQQASKYVKTLALSLRILKGYVQKETEDQFDMDFNESLNLLFHSRDRWARVAETHARIEEDLNEGLRVIATISRRRPLQPWP